MNRFLKVVIAVLTALVMTVLHSCAGNGNEADGEQADLKVYCHQAGKADAIVITTKEHTVVLDTGVKGFGGTILDGLSKEGIKKIDYLIISHFDKDHVGGAAKVINSIDVGTVLQSNCPKESSAYEKYTEALENASLTPVTVRETYSFELDGVEFSVDPPSKDVYNDDESNNSSLILTVKCHGKTLLFTGDAESERIREFISKGLSADCDFIKMPHHGEWDSMLEKLLQNTKPEYAVITSSDDEPEDAKTAELLEKYGVKTFLTRTDPVIISCTGDTMTVEYDG
ncbi:MAG: MBL fold metallo-hydrolase [Clostridia bacterium]|nr:MBL fold metallo-hydrolase [Clostridia bacterium]